MEIFKITGIITSVIAAGIVMWIGYRNLFPKKYTWNNCPNDHKLMAEFGFKGNCGKCCGKIG